MLQVKRPPAIAAKFHRECYPDAILRWYYARKGWSGRMGTKDCSAPTCDLAFWEVCGCKLHLLAVCKALVAVSWRGRNDRPTDPALFFGREGSA